MDRPLREYYFTFGSAHAHAKGYYVIEAENELQARIKMVTMFAKHWCTSYKSKESAGIDKYKLTEVGRARVHPNEIQDLKLIADSHYQ